MILTLDAIKDWLKTLDLEAEHYYIGKLDNKQDKSIGTYLSKRTLEPYIALGGIQNTSYRQKAITFLIHWNKNQDTTEKASLLLYERLEEKTNFRVGEVEIGYLELLDAEPIDVGTDEKGVYEMVINAVFYYERKET